MSNLRATKTFGSSWLREGPSVPGAIAGSSGEGRLGVLMVLPKPAAALGALFLKTPIFGCGTYSVWAGEVLNPNDHHPAGWRWGCEWSLRPPVWLRQIVSQW